ncbi:hypothetical protein Bca4012_003744 [Brassica carinata]
MSTTLVCIRRSQTRGGVVAGMNVNGSIHWVFILEEANKRVVVAFDVKTEEFREVPLPGEAEDVSRNFVAGDLNGRLCVINSCSEEHDDVWVRCSEFLDQNPVQIFVQVYETAVFD